MAKKKKPFDGFEPNHTLTLEQAKDETGAQAMARKLLEPHLRHASCSSTYSDKLLGSQFEGPGVTDFIDHMQKVCAEAEKGDLAIASRLLAAQAVTLDNMFTELARRAALNVGEYMGATESYGRLALRAQSNCRTTLEALAKLHQPREQTVRHVHVNEGGQAVVADQFHNHFGGRKNAKSNEQSHATGKSSESAPMLGHDAQGGGVPISSGEGQTAMQDARRDKSGRA